MFVFMILPYVYKLTHKITGQFYIGYRAANKIIAEKDLGIKYFSSSKKVKELGFDNFNIEIVAMFFDSKDAATANKFNAGELSNILKGKRKLNKIIWQAEYLS